MSTQNIWFSCINKKKTFWIPVLSGTVYFIIAVYIFISQVCFEMRTDLPDTSNFSDYTYYKSQHMAKPTKWRVCRGKTDQPGHPPSLLRLFGECSLGS